MAKRDLIVLFADLDAENAVKVLLAGRREDLGLRPIEFDTIRHAMRDSGCFRQADSMLRSYLRTHSYALVLFDHHGSGQERTAAGEVERDVETRLMRNGWKDRAACIVFEPELEAWVWSGSSHVADLLGFEGNLDSMKHFLYGRELLSHGLTKPQDPKSAVEACLRNAKKSRSARLYGHLAERVDLQPCEDRAFAKFTETLRRWFSA
jgi:hypothetical protein